MYVCVRARDREGTQIEKGLNETALCPVRTPRLKRQKPTQAISTVLHMTGPLTRSYVSERSKAPTQTKLAIKTVRFSLCPSIPIPLRWVVRYWRTPLEYTWPLSCSSCVPRESDVPPKCSRNFFALVVWMRGRRERGERKEGPGVRHMSRLAPGRGIRLYKGLQRKLINVLVEFSKKGEESTEEPAGQGGCLCAFGREERLGNGEEG